jgi:hypothetical protein
VVEIDLDKTQSIALAGSCPQQTFGLDERKRNSG